MAPSLARGYLRAMTHHALAIAISLIVGAFTAIAMSLAAVRHAIKHPRAT